MQISNNFRAGLKCHLRAAHTSKTDDSITRNQFTILNCNSIVIFHFIKPWILGLNSWTFTCLNKYFIGYLWRESFTIVDFIQQISPIFVLFLLQVYFLRIISLFFNFLFFTESVVTACSTYNSNSCITHSANNKFFRSSSIKEKENMFFFYYLDFILFLNHVFFFFYPFLSIF